MNNKNNMCVEQGLCVTYTEGALGPPCQGGMIITSLTSQCHHSFTHRCCHGDDTCSVMHILWCGLVPASHMYAERQQRTCALSLRSL